MKPRNKIEVTDKTWVKMVGARSAMNRGAVISVDQVRIAPGSSPWQHDEPVVAVCRTRPGAGIRGCRLILSGAVVRSSRQIIS